jgi:hypothetical protein
MSAVIWVSRLCIKCIAIAQEDFNHSGSAVGAKCRDSLILCASDANRYGLDVPADAGPSFGTGGVLR